MLLVHSWPRGLTRRVWETSSGGIVCALEIALLVQYRYDNRFFVGCYCRAKQPSSSSIPSQLPLRRDQRIAFCRDHFNVWTHSIHVHQPPRSPQRPKIPSLFALAFSDPIDFAPTYKYAVGTDEYDTRNDKKVRSGRRAAVQYNTASLEEGGCRLHTSVLLLVFSVSPLPLLLAIYASLRLQRTRLICSRPRAVMACV